MTPLPKIDILLPRSEDMSGIVLTGRYADYGNAGTRYSSWSSSGSTYSSWTDDEANGVSPSSKGSDATGGYTTIVIGDDHLHLRIADVAAYKAPPESYEWRYPTLGPVHTWFWFNATYCLHETAGHGLNRDIRRPFADFCWSTTRCEMSIPHRKYLQPPFFESVPNKPGLPHWIDAAVTDGGDTSGCSRTYVPESPRMVGPWHLVTYLHDLEDQAYLMNCAVAAVDDCSYKSFTTKL